MQTYSLLIVEDNDEDYEYLCAKLPSDYQISRASSASEAIQIFARTTFDLIIFDIGLPDGDGPTLCQEFLGSFENPAPYIFLTGLPTAIRRQQFSEINEAQVIDKNEVGTPHFLVKILRRLDRKSIAPRGDEVENSYERIGGNTLKIAIEVGENLKRAKGHCADSSAKVESPPTFWNAPFS